MGTNFYWIGDGDEYERHIGKRSAAGLFCWDCNVTLIDGGIESIHTGRGKNLKACPRCSNAVGIGSQLSHSVMVELGWAEPTNARPIGITACSSFSWAKEPEQVGVILREKMFKRSVVDEYGNELTGEEFMEMLRNNSPIQFTHSIGVAFS